MRILFYSILMILLCRGVFAEEKNLLLCTAPVSPELFTQETSDPDLADKNLVKVVGIINEPEFAIKSVKNVILYDTKGKKIPVVFDTSSIYSEFGDGIINSVRIAFITENKDVKDQSFRLQWDAKINNNINKEVPKIVFHKKNQDQYMRFEWVHEVSKEDSERLYQASVSVIVDDQADKYYLWYLLPIAIVFCLLIVRKFFR